MVLLETAWPGEGGVHGVCLCPLGASGSGGTCVLLGPAPARPSLQKLLYFQCWELLWSCERAVGREQSTQVCDLHGWYQTEGGRTRGNGFKQMIEPHLGLDEILGNLLCR